MKPWSDNMRKKKSDIYNFFIRMVFRGLVNVRPLVEGYLIIDIGTYELNAWQFKWSKQGKFSKVKPLR